MNNRTFSHSDQQMLEALMLHRRDIRGNNFRPDPVSDECVNQLLQCASLAPSVGFSQPWEFVVIRDEQVKTQIAANFDRENARAAPAFEDEKQRLYRSLKLEGIREAPVNIAVFYKPSTEPVLGQNSMVEVGEYSVVCAIQNMWLMARAMNLGLGWVSILDPESVKETLNAPAENKLVAYLCLGYVKEFFSAPELERLNWKLRKDLSSAVFRDIYPRSS
jgi:5,6-dimethylbenzimidazole synthase